MSIYLKTDSYRISRGGYSRLVRLFCNSCSGYLALYQKDGPGSLRRLYIDRLHASKIDAATTLASCSHCAEQIGVFGIYKKESRPIIRLFVDSVQKKK